MEVLFFQLFFKASMQNENLRKSATAAIFCRWVNATGYRLSGPSDFVIECLTHALANERMIQWVGLEKNFKSAERA